MGIKFEIIFPPLGFLEGRPKEKKIVFYASLPCQRRTKKSHMSYFFSSYLCMLDMFQAEFRE